MNTSSSANHPERYARFPIQDIARAPDVSRWHSLPCYRHQSIAEHQYLVGMYARELLVCIMPEATVIDRLLLLEYVSFHDIPEVLTGDMPTPVKRFFERHFADGISPLSALEESICPELKQLSDSIRGTPMERIAKLADILDAIKFIREEGKHQSNLYESVTDLRGSMMSAIQALLEPDESTRKEGLELVLESLKKADELEKQDPINRISIERTDAYKARVESSRAEYPDLNWDAAYDVLDRVLNGQHLQIDFIER
ncbi:YfbR-like 5'-deoxynucleotidase [Pseudomonas syringae pv. actinidiae]|nr:YfbR-like 5'-deoxynucleotidase [Pseudomonas syringae pv. actinidiae]